MIPFSPSLVVRRDFSRFARCASILWLVSALALVSGRSAPLSAAAQARAEAEKQAFAASAALYLAGNLAEAEQALVAVNRSASGTGAWRFESARRLAEMSHHLRGGGGRSAALTTAAAALQHLAAVTNRSSAAYDAAIAPRAWELAGGIYDSLCEDPASALFAYREAVKLNPNAQRAQAEAERLARVVETLSRAK